MRDPNIKVGCWITTCFGPAILTEIVEDDAYTIQGNGPPQVIERFASVRFRYPATRCSDGKFIWVANGRRLDEISYLGPPDEETAAVLKLTGPYGEGRTDDMPNADKV